MSHDLCERLQEHARHAHDGLRAVPASDLREAAAQLAALTAENTRLREALERIKRVVTYPADTSIQPLGYGVRSTDITGCELIVEIARAALSQEAPK